MPTLLRHARTAYSSAMRTALAEAGYEDIPNNGLYVIGVLATQTAVIPLGRLIAVLQLSKQAAGQLIDTLVTRGYVERNVDHEDRRKLTIGLTERGHVAAKILGQVRATVDAAVLSRVGSDDLERTRRTLMALADLGRQESPQTDSFDIERSTPMEIKSRTEILDVQNSNLAQSRFDDVNLRASAFNNVALADATFVNVNLKNVSIRDANLTGMTINGVLVTDLMRARETRPMTVLYAKSVERVQQFYRDLLSLRVEQIAIDHVLLGSPQVQLAIIQIPPAIAATIEIGAPPTRRSETPIKPVFEVASIAATRERAASHGGELLPADKEWSYQGFRVCDGQDPEGNVVQFRERQSAN
jgi:DNA-binding MarR family transcriptional regulator/predicted enzyme related to lactoylglutathione lyase